MVDIIDAIIMRKSIREFLHRGIGFVLFIKRAVNHKTIKCEMNLSHNAIVIIRIYLT